VFVLGWCVVSASSGLYLEPKTLRLLFSSLLLRLEGLLYPGGDHASSVRPLPPSWQVTAGSPVVMSTVSGGHFEYRACVHLGCALSRAPQVASCPQGSSCGKEGDHLS
jgi:hypothetical protein